MTSLGNRLAPLRGARSTTRQPFPTWSIELPSAFSETFIDDGGYWHAWDARRSVSLTSMTLRDGHRPVSAREVAATFPPLSGEPVGDLPPDLVGRAAYGEAQQPARATRALSGLLATDGRVLIVTITSDDFEWARATWLSIRHQPVEVGAASPANARPAPPA